MAKVTVGEFSDRNGGDAAGFWHNTPNSQPISLYASPFRDHIR